MSLPLRGLKCRFYVIADMNHEGYAGIEMQSTRIGFLAFDGITALDLVGPMEAFAAAALDDGQGTRRPCYARLTIGVTGKAFTSESGLAFQTGLLGSGL